MLHQFRHGSVSIESPPGHFQSFAWEKQKEPADREINRLFESRELFGSLAVCRRGLLGSPNSFEFFLNFVVVELLLSPILVLHSDDAVVLLLALNRWVITLNDFCLL